jgi:hypothetical protein
MLGIEDDVEQRLLQQQRIALDARQALFVTAHDLDVCRAECAGAQRENA